MNSCESTLSRELNNTSLSCSFQMVADFRNSWKLLQNDADFRQVAKHLLQSKVQRVDQSGVDGWALIKGNFELNLSRCATKGDNINASYRLAERFWRLFQGGMILRNPPLGSTTSANSFARDYDC